MSDFWLKFFLFLLIYGLLIFFFNRVMRKWLKVKKKKLFSYNHLNKKHKKVDWIIRITFVILIIVGGFYNAIQNPLERIWFLETHIVVFAFILASETVRAVMEKRYAENRNDYKYTLSQLGFISLSLLLIFTTNFFGLFN
jgi:undecaprenyl pyrophosphate phosphatase UppP